MIRFKTINGVCVFLPFSKLQYLSVNNEKELYTVRTDVTYFHLSYKEYCRVADIVLNYLPVIKND